MGNLKCVQCGWLENDHRNGFCYEHSDESTDYFYNDRKFISEESLKGKKWGVAFNGMIVIHGEEPSDNKEIVDTIFEAMAVRGYELNKPGGKILNSKTSDELPTK